MSAHTPGPWVVEKGGVIKSTAPEAGKHYTRAYPQVALVVGLHEDRPEGEREANERLIAAAPEMLKALNEIAYGCLTDGRVDLDKIDEVARGAIAKAVGK